MGVATATALVGAGISAYSAIKGAKDKKEAQRAMDNYERQELNNPYENIQLSTYGTDIQRQDASRDVATLTDAARNAGIRGILGGLPKIQAKSNRVNQNIGMQLEQQEINRQRAIARGEMQLTGIRENRDVENINALSSQYNAGNQQMWGSIMGTASGLASAGRAVDNSGFGFTPQVDSVNSGVENQGITPYSVMTDVPKLQY